MRKDLQEHPQGCTLQKALVGALGKLCSAWQVANNVPTSPKTSRLAAIGVVCHAWLYGGSALEICGSGSPGLWRRLRAMSLPLAAHPRKGGDCGDAFGAWSGFEFLAPQTLLQVLVWCATAMREQAP